MRKKDLWKVGKLGADCYEGSDREYRIYIFTREAGMNHDGK